jgi:hypothetical protein
MGLFVERIKPLLPAAVALDANLDTSENHLFSTTEIDAQLDDIAILYPEGFRLDIWLT